MADQFDVFMFALPEVPEAGESILGPECQTKRFDTLESARDFAEQNKTTYNRITINVASSEQPTLVERYDDGVRIKIEQQQTEPTVEPTATGSSTTAPGSPPVTQAATPVD